MTNNQYYELIEKLEIIIRLLNDNIPQQEETKEDNAANYLASQDLHGILERELYTMYCDLHTQLNIKTVRMTRYNLNKLITDNTDFKLKNTSRKGRSCRIWKR